MPYYRCAACGVPTYSAAAYSSANLCPSCDAALTEDAKLYVFPGGGSNISRILFARPEAASEARRALGDLPFPQITREDLELLVSELVTNSVRHAGLADYDPIGISLVNGAGRARLAVHDGGHGFTPTLSGWDDGPPAAGGRGLAIVDALSDAWGVDCDPEGCTVWCEVAVAEPETSVPC